MTFLVTIRVNAGALREHGGSDYRLVLGDPYPGNALHITADVSQFCLLQGVGHFEMVVQHTEETGDRSVSGTFAEPVHSGVHSPCAGLDRRCGIGHGEVVIIVSVEVEMPIREFRNHYPHEFSRLLRRKDSKGVRQHESPYPAVFQCIYH